MTEEEFTKWKHTLGLALADLEAAKKGIVQLKEVMAKATAPPAPREITCRVPRAWLKPLQDQFFLDVYPAETAFYWNVALVPGGPVLGVIRFTTED